MKKFSNEFILPSGSNRTFMELKLSELHQCVLEDIRSNRTFMELKC